MNFFKDEPIFKNETIYNSKLYNKFIKFHNNKFGNRYMYFTIILCLFFIYCIIENFIAKNIWISLLLLLIMILFIYYRIFRPIYTYKNTRKTFSKSKEIKFTFIFYNHYFKIINKNKKKNYTSKFYYINLHKIIEDKNYFYLYINDENAAIISKTGFVLGKEEDFNIFIRKKCFFKYSKEKYQNTSK